MANDEHVAIVQQGAHAIAKWREENPDDPLDLRGADLSGLNLRGADLHDVLLLSAYVGGVDLTGANLKGAILRSANMDRAYLDGTNLVDANLHFANLAGAYLESANLCRCRLAGAILRGAGLYGASLVGADLRGASFANTDLGGADLTNALMEGTYLDDVDLAETKGLEKVRHLGPSTVGVDTLYKSRGKIPAEFLRGCGVPDGQIEYLPSLLGMQQAIQFYSCFISYSHKDEGFCKRLHSRMRDEHLRVWYATEDVQGGKKLHEQIDHAIRLHDKLLVVLSEHSMSSEWVTTEVRKARQREVKEGKRVLFPIHLVSFDAIREWEAFDADTGKDMAVELREYFIPDFSNWKDHDAFEAAFRRLLDDLNKDD